MTFLAGRPGFPFATGLPATAATTGTTEILTPGAAIGTLVLISLYASSVNNLPHCFPQRPHAAGSIGL
ncbi:MAG TPA: hypothetical protein VG892_14595 [Terriglobales bacterium]|nr:hypothetical protein [Terriglobales bacterium]